MTDAQSLKSDHRWSNAPEVFYPAGLELARRSQGFPTDSKNGPNLEDTYPEEKAQYSDEKVPDESEKNHYEHEKEPYASSEKEITTGQPKLLSEAGELGADGNVHKKSKRWCIIVVVVVALIVVIAAVVGGVVGSRRASSQASDQSTSSSNQSTSGQTSSPENSPNSHSSLLKNSSLTTVTCPNGKRWLFVQNSKGNLQAVEYSSSTSKWNTSTAYSDFPNAAPATPMTASCVNISDNLNNKGSLQLGQYASLVYLDKSSAVQQSIFNGDKWQNITVLPATVTPIANTKLSVSTNIIPSLSLPPGLSPTNNTDRVTGLLGPALSSVLVYQSTNWSLVMIDITPGKKILSQTGDIHNPNMLRKFSTLPGGPGFTYEPRGLSFGCTYNVLNPIPSDSAQLYARLSIGNPSANIIDLKDYNYHYNQETLINASLAIRPDAVAPTFVDAKYGSNVIHIQLSQNNQALVYMHSNNTISVVFSKPSATAHDDPAEQPYQTAADIVLPVDQFTAAACTAELTIVCVYFQVNETTIGEFTYDTITWVWTPLVYVKIY